MRALEGSGFGIWANNSGDFCTPGLEKLSKSEYGMDMTTVSVFCMGDKFPKEIRLPKTTEDAQLAVQAAFGRLSHIKNIQYLTLKKRRKRKEIGYVTDLTSAMCGICSKSTRFSNRSAGTLVDPLASPHTLLV